MSVFVTNTTLSPRPSSFRLHPLPAQSGWRRTAKCDPSCAPNRGLQTPSPDVLGSSGPSSGVPSR